MMEIRRHRSIAAAGAIAWAAHDLPVPERRRVIAILTVSIVLRILAIGLIVLMNECLERFPGLKVFSLPHMSDTDRYIELGVRGDAGRISAAMAQLQEGVIALGFTWARTP